MIAELCNFLTLGGTIAVSTAGVAFGLSRIGESTTKALYLQPSAQKEITKVSIFAMALTETGGVIALVIAIFLLVSLGNVDASNLYQALARIGIFFSTGVISFIVGYASSKPARNACLSIARQPFFASQILNIMLITMSIIQTPIFFGFLISILINIKAPGVTTLYEGLALLCAGLVIGIGSIGPVLGQAIYATRACAAPGKNRASYQKVFVFSFISQAMIEAPIIFSLLIAFLILSTVGRLSLSLLSILMIAGAAFSGSFTNITPGIFSGKCAATACEQITYRPEQYPLLMQTSLIAQGFLDTFAIYGLFVGLMLVLFIR